MLKIEMKEINLKTGDTIRDYPEKGPTERERKRFTGKFFSGAFGMGQKLKEKLKRWSKL